MVTTEGITYQQYVDAYASGNFNNPHPLGLPERRIVVVPIGHCTEDAGGATQIEFLGVGCFFLTNSMAQGGQATLDGEFIKGCGTQIGVPGASPNSQTGVYWIVLHKDSMSSDS
jgi:hypothetical protein